MSTSKFTFRRGAAPLELAMILPLHVALLAAILYLGMGVHRQLELANGTRSNLWKTRFSGSMNNFEPFNLQQSQGDLSLSNTRTLQTGLYLDWLGHELYSSHILFDGTWATGDSKAVTVVSASVPNEFPVASLRWPPTPANTKAVYRPVKYTVENEVPGAGNDGGGKQLYGDQQDGANRLQRSIDDGQNFSLRGVLESQTRQHFPSIELANPNAEAKGEHKKEGEIFLPFNLYYKLAKDTKYHVPIITEELTIVAVFEKDALADYELKSAVFEINTIQTVELVLENGKKELLKLHKETLSSQNQSKEKSKIEKEGDTIVADWKPRYHGDVYVHAEIKLQKRNKPKPVPTYGFNSSTCTYKILDTATMVAERAKLMDKVCGKGTDIEGKFVRDITKTYRLNNAVKQENEIDWQLKFLVDSIISKDEIVHKRMRDEKKHVEGIRAGFNGYYIDKVIGHGLDVFVRDGSKVQIPNGIYFVGFVRYNHDDTNALIRDQSQRPRKQTDEQAKNATNAFNPEALEVLLVFRDTDGHEFWGEILDSWQNMASLGVAIDQYLYAKDGVVKWAEALYNNASTNEESNISIAGYSLGGALAQWFAINWTTDDFGKEDIKKAISERKKAEKEEKKREKAERKEAQNNNIGDIEVANVDVEPSKNKTQRRIKQIDLYKSPGINKDWAAKFNSENCGPIRMSVYAWDLVALVGHFIKPAKNNGDIMDKNSSRVDIYHSKDILGKITHGIYNYSQEALEATENLPEKYEEYRATPKEKYKETFVHSEWIMSIPIDEFSADGFRYDFHSSEFIVQMVLDKEIKVDLSKYLRLFPTQQSKLTYSDYLREAPFYAKFSRSMAEGARGNFLGRVGGVIKIIVMDTKTAILDEKIRKKNETGPTEPQLPGLKWGTWSKRSAATPQGGQPSENQ